MDCTVVRVSAPHNPYKFPTMETHLFANQSNPEAQDSDAVGRNFKPWGLAFLVTQMVKSLPAMQEVLVWSLGQEDPLEKGIATHSSILAWRIPWTEEPGRLQSTGL